MNARISLRISATDRERLGELRDLLAQPSDSAAIRVLIRLHHATAKREIARLRKARKAGK